MKMLIVLFGLLAWIGCSEESDVKSPAAVLDVPPRSCLVYVSFAQLHVRHRRQQPDLHTMHEIIASGLLQHGIQHIPHNGHVQVYDPEDASRLNEVIEVVGVLSRVPEVAAAHAGAHGADAMMEAEFLAAHPPTRRVVGSTWLPYPASYCFHFVFCKFHFVSIHVRSANL